MINKARKEFYIPQIPENRVSLRKEKTGFVKSEMVSPMQGPYTKDVSSIPDQDYHQDIDSAYDAFRVEKKMTKEEEIRKHGRAYHEFPDVSTAFSNSDYSKKDNKLIEEAKDERIGFNLKGFNAKAKENLPPLQLFKEEEKKEEKVEEDLSSSSYIEETEINEDFVPDRTIEQKEKVEEILVEEEKVDDNPIPKTIITYNDRSENKTEDYASFDNEDDELSFDEETVSNSQYEEEKPVQIIKPVVEENKPVERVEPVQKKEESKVINVDKYRNYIYPPLSLIDPVKSSTFELPAWIDEKKEIINQTLAQFGIDAEVVSFTYGPRVTRYEIKLAQGVNVKKITNIDDNLKMNLCAKTIRIEAPIPGKSNVGIEVPNDTSRMVQFGELVFKDEFKNEKNPLTFALGLNIDGKPIYLSITKALHSLIAGGTGSGKSVCINSILISLLLKYSPDEVRFIMVDPKQVELISYADIPHLVTPVITDPKMASEALKWACTEMDRRFRSFPAMRVRDIKSFNERVKADKSLGIKQLPYLVIVIDEFADLMMNCGGDVEDSVKRITQLGRAAGIHLIVATQRPTTNIINGTIKTNIPTRIAFRLSQFVDSMTILDQGGAEGLLGHGDMLLKQEDVPERIQGAYLTDEEIQRVTDFVRDHYQPDYIFTHEALQEKTKQAYGASNKEDMELVHSIALTVVERGLCSINYIQKTFGIGFNRAQGIVDILEEMGVVSQTKGPSGREILMSIEEVDELFANLDK